jgi:hypothetical protein
MEVADKMSMGQAISLFVTVVILYIIQNKVPQMLSGIISYTAGGGGGMGGVGAITGSASAAAASYAGARMAVGGAISAAGKIPGIRSGGQMGGGE